VHVKPSGQDLGRCSRGFVVGNEQEGAAFTNPIADGVALLVGEGGIPRARQDRKPGPMALATTSTWNPSSVDFWKGW
jgi:hypothetical protein